MADEPMALKFKSTERIEKIRSDAFKIVSAEIEGDLLTIDVSFTGDQADHDFMLYWDGSVNESYPVQVHVSLKHDAAGDTAGVEQRRALVFKLGKDIEQPTVYHIHNDHGDRISVRYGKSELDQR